MSASLTIREEIAEALKASDIYNQNSRRWQFLYESYMGGDDYRRAHHLTRYQLETDAEYNARLMATPLENHCQSVVSVYNSFLFRKGPDREFGSIANLSEVLDFLNDADLEGRNLDAFMKEVATWASVFGHSWILMSKPDVGADTMAQEQSMGVRPYVNVLSPLVVTDWRWTRMPNGRYILAYLKYVEDINGDVRTIVEWTADTIRRRIINEKDTVVEMDETVPNSLGVIPAVIVYNARSTVRGIGVSAINDIADLQKFIYNATSEVDQSIRLDSHPSIVTTIDTNIGTGAGAVIRVPENMDPSLKPYVLDFAGANIANIYTSINHTIGVIEKMANLGSIRATESRTISGVAMETEFQLLNARLSDFADNLENAEEQMWRLFCMYQQQPYDMSIHYPDSFQIRDVNRELSELEIASRLLGESASPAVQDRIAQLLDMEIRDETDNDDDVGELNGTEVEPL